jgi:hypothetical protein
VVVDIGSNDGTLLSRLASPGSLCIGVEPNGSAMARYYDKSAVILSEFFTDASVDAIVKRHGRAKLVTSIAMFYDLEDPVAFARSVERLLAPDGVWITEQSWLSAMVARTAYDTICHEHVEYYRLVDILNIARQSGLRVIDATENGANGGSLRVTLVRESDRRVASRRVADVVDAESQLNDGTAIERMGARARSRAGELRDLLVDLQSSGARVVGYGASTKGNVVLQYSGITRDILPMIAEVNADKYGRRTPGTGIPIVSEKEASAYRPTHYLVLPWHFREALVLREAEFLKHGGRMIFPLPRVESVGQ